MATRKTKTENKRIARAAMKAAKGGATPAPVGRKAKRAAAHAAKA